MNLQTPLHGVAASSGPSIMRLHGSAMVELLPPASIKNLFGKSDNSRRWNEWANKCLSSSQSRYTRSGSDPRPIAGTPTILVRFPNRAIQRSSGKAGLRTQLQKAGESGLQPHFPACRVTADYD